MRKHGAALAAERKVELILALLMNMLLYHCVACTAVSAVYASGWRDHYLWMLWLVLPLFFLAYVRYYVKSFVLFLLLHIMMPLGCFLLGRDMGEKLVLVICAMIMLVLSVGMGTKERWKVKESPALGMLVVFLNCYFLGYYMENPMLMSLSYRELFGFLVLFFLDENLNHKIDFIQKNQHIRNIPIRQMAVINRLLMVLFLSVLLVAMIFVPRMHLEVVLIPIFRGILFFIAWLFSLLHFNDASEKMESTGEKMGQIMQLGGMEPAKEGLLWAILEKLLPILVIALLAAAFVGGIAYLLYRLYKGFYAEEKENTDEKEFLSGELFWFSRELFSGRKENKKDGGTINQRIRKCYRRYVKKGFGRKEPVPDTMTPMEILGLLEKKKPERARREEEQQKIREIYENARYGTEECTQLDLALLKRLTDGR